MHTCVQGTVLDVLCLPQEVLLAAVLFEPLFTWGKLPFTFKSRPHNHTFSLFYSDRGPVQVSVLYARDECVEGLKSVNLLLSSHRFSRLVQGLKLVTSLTSMSHFSPWTMQTLIHLVVFLLVLSLCHAAWGCLILLDMGHLPTLLSLSGSMMPIFTSEWGRESMHISPTFPLRQLSDCTCTSSLSHCVSPLTGFDCFFSTGLSDIGVNKGKRARCQWLSYYCQLWMNNLLSNWYPCS